MNLPGGGNAIVDIAKLRGYCLDRGILAAGIKPESLQPRWGWRNPSFFGKSCFARRGRPMRWWASLTNMATASP
jgi:hypothetical protein